MSDKNEHAALDRILRIAKEALRETQAGEPEHSPSAARAVCTPKSLPNSLLVQAARKAAEINPMNSPIMQFAPGAMPADPLSIAALTTKYWGPNRRRLTVKFMDTNSKALKDKILQYMNAWSKTACITFVETSGTGQVRISRGAGGYWSYLGTDILQIPANRPTMNLEGFTVNTSDDEYKRVVCHETGHTLSFPHEHMRKELIARIDRQKAYDYFWRTQRWDRAMVDAQVLTPLDDATIIRTPPDQTSIMCYQLPGQITKDGKPILGGKDINTWDFAFAGKIYPKHGQQAAAMDDDLGIDDDNNEAFENDDEDSSELYDPNLAI